MAIFRWKPSARTTNPVTVLSTGLNSLAANGAALSAAVSNDASDELDMYADFELFINGFGTAPTENTTVEGYLVRQIDGTNYEQQSSEGRPKSGPQFLFVVDNTTATQRLIAPMVLVPPVDFKVQLINKTNQAFPAATNTLKAYFYTTQSV